DDGVRFAVWAPNARAVSVTGDWNGWRDDADALEPAGGSGVWEGVAGASEGDRYKLAVLGAGGVPRLKAGPYAFEAEVPPATASIVNRSRYAWGDADWLSQRRSRDPLASPLSVYEMHAGSWRLAYGWPELADSLPGYVEELGFTHVELMPVMQ